MGLKLLVFRPCATNVSRESFEPFAFAHLVRTENSVNNAVFQQENKGVQSQMFFFSF